MADMEASAERPAAREFSARLGASASFVQTRSPRRAAPKAQSCGRRHRAGRAGLRAQLANNATAIIDGQSVVARFDRPGRADRRAVPAAVAARLRIEARACQHAILAVLAALARPGGRRFAAAPDQTMSTRPSALLSVAAGHGQTEARFIDRVIHHVAVMHGERERPPIRERRRLDLDAGEPPSGPKWTA